MVRKEPLPVPGVLLARSAYMCVRVCAHVSVCDGASAYICVDENLLVQMPLVTVGHVRAQNNPRDAFFPLADSFPLPDL